MSRAQNPALNPEERAALIDRYAAGYEQVARALADFPADGLTAHPLPGKWSAAEIVHHLADSESISAQRLRKLLVEKNPVIWGYDQEAYTERLHYNRRELAPALEAFRAARATTLQILRAMTDADWEKRGWHSDSGPYAPDEWLRIYAAHAHDHAAQITRLREALASGARA